MPAGQSYRLGKNNTFTFGSMIANNDVQNVTVTIETSAEAEVTSRGSGDIQEFLPVRKNTVYEVTCWYHSCSMHSTGVVTIAPAAGTTGMSGTGMYYVNNIGEPQEIDGAIVNTITLRKYALG
jgi:hypothetical protein